MAMMTDKQRDDYYMQRYGMTYMQYRSQRDAEIQKRYGMTGKAAAPAKPADLDQFTRIEQKLDLIIEAFRLQGVL
jgi:hypothetical protein